MILSEYLQQNDLTVIAFSKQLKCSRGIIYQYLAGKKTPSPSSMVEIAKITNNAVQPNDFIPTNIESADDDQPDT